MTQYCRGGSPEDPWISAGNHPTKIVYGENGNSHHKNDDALNFGGANVWTNSEPPSVPPDMDMTVDGYAHVSHANAKGTR